MAVCFAAGALAAMAEPIPARHARVELISRDSSAAPGHDFRVGVHFMLERGWHIYWINPGDSGQPPSLQWHLPAGFSAGEIQWPRPHKLQSSPSLADYGYHDDVLLMVPLRVPGSQKPGSRAEIHLQAKWLICREVCIPDHAQLRLTVAIAAAARPNHQTAAQLFSAAERLLPRPWPRAWKAGAESRKEDFLLRLQMGKPVGAAEFFPLDAGQIENSARQKIQPSVKGVNIILKKSDLLLKPVAVLRGVLVLPGRGAFQVEAPVAGQAALK